jgi:hypothetical protein
VVVHGKDLRSSELKTWPFWRTRARGSAMAVVVVTKCVCFCGSGNFGWCYDWYSGARVASLMNAN